MTANPVFHIPLSSPHFPSCHPVFERGLELNIPQLLWPECFAFKNWCCVGFDSTYEVELSSLTEISLPQATTDAFSHSTGHHLSLQRSSADRLAQRVMERQRLQEKRTRAAKLHLESYGFMETLLEEVEGGTGAGVANEKGTIGTGSVEGRSSGPGLGPSRATQRSSTTVDADARSVISSRASLTVSSDADTLVDKDRLSSKWSLGSLLTGSRRSSVISDGEDSHRAPGKDIELPNWKHE